MIQYANYSFFSLLQEQPYQLMYNNDNMTDHVEDWIKLLQDSLNEVTSKAASAKPGNKYATKEA